ncbi:MAG TPA: hypothetical protein VKO45_03475 [Methanomicrobiales archaeon]|nr:hypothetical protein [Methanomicrobiales archaeon]
MHGGPETRRVEPPPFGDVLLEVLKGIRSEILLYGIAVLIIVVGSAVFGIEVLRELEYPLLIFATFVLIIYFLANLVKAWRKSRPEEGKDRRP